MTTSRTMVDTSVLLRLFDDDQPDAQAAARGLFGDPTGPNLVLLADGLAAFYEVTTEGFRRSLPQVTARQALTDLAELTVVHLDADLVMAAADTAMEEGFDFVALGRALIADPDLVARIAEVVGWPATEADYRKAAELVPDDLVRSLMAVGTTAQCRDGVAAYLDAGVTCPILYPLMDDMVPVIDGFAGWAP